MHLPKEGALGAYHARNKSQANPQIEKIIESRLTFEIDTAFFW